MTARAKPNLQQRLRPDLDPADPITARLFQSLQVAAWAKNNSPDQDEAHAFERQCFDYLLHGSANLNGRTCRHSIYRGSGRSDALLKAAPGKLYQSVGVREVSTDPVQGWLETQPILPTLTRTKPVVPVLIAGPKTPPPSTPPPAL
jgi:hypothetical protein